MLVVAGHVIGSGPGGGIQVDHGSFWRYLYSLMDYIQMPLFTAIAGWVYALKPAGTVCPRKFVKNKALRLLVPMVTVSAIYFLTQYLVPGTNNKIPLEEMWKIIVFPYTLYWYLKALFLIFMAVFLLDRCGAMSTARGWALTLAAGILLYVAEVTVIPYGVPNFFAFKGAINQLPYFLAGVGICRFGRDIYRRFRHYIIAMAVMGVILLHIHRFEPGMNEDLYQSMLPLWLVPALFILFRFAKPNRVFVFLGAYAYSIYLFHGFGTSGGRIIFHALGIYNEFAVFVFAFALAILLPVAADKILSRNDIAALLLLGKPRRNDTRRGSGTYGKKAFGHNFVFAVRERKDI